jgi:hypothetical protein
MTVAQQERYQRASTRNVKNFLDRFNGVNRGTPETRKQQVARLSDIKDLGVAQLKHILGVRPEDSSFNGKLEPVVEFIQDSLKKASKAAKAKEADSKKEEPQKLTLTVVEEPTAERDEAEKPGKPGRKKITLKGIKK